MAITSTTCPVCNIIFFLLLHSIVWLICDVSLCTGPETDYAAAMVYVSLHDIAYNSFIIVISFHWWACFQTRSQATCTTPVDPPLNTIIKKLFGGETENSNRKGNISMWYESGEKRPSKVCLFLSDAAGRCHVIHSVLTIAYRSQHGGTHTRVWKQSAVWPLGPCWLLLPL